MQHVAIISACSLPWAELLSFSLSGETEKKLHGYSLLGGGSLSRLTLCQMWAKITRFSLSTMVANIQPSSKKVSSYPFGAADSKLMIL